MMSLNSIMLRNTLSDIFTTSIEIVGEIITGLRLKRGYTQQEISDAIGIARQTYAGYERGTVRRKGVFLLCLAL